MVVGIYLETKGPPKSFLGLLVGLEQQDSNMGGWNKTRMEWAK